MIDFGAAGRRAVYQQLADLLRASIEAGEVAPGGLLPSSKRLEQTYGVSRETVRRALGVLRAEGLVETEPSYGTRVRYAAERHRVSVPRGASVVSLPASHAQRHALGVAVGEHVLVVTVGGRIVGEYPASTTELTCR
ncbi:winged helix-turn-helix transcriptional regulator [Micromonospora sp. Llam7]|uniref:GntR family transcriptional regulator n=1 Tax=Micromonospora tarapacensis TaxID=2835305 RepID=UPI001C82D75D|nr:winged helix-turn-helix domain-containing protein [Micromonospora tarapacensis]MBX7264900.1 winged helix-turn-helix transcriptional regulator [Micromonospora tarapacensis]